MRINVVGTSGSGKSTFAKSIAKKFNAPYVQMDEIFWKPNWKESCDEEFFSKVEEVVSTDRWILDGNYTRTYSYQMEACADGGVFRFTLSCRSLQNN